MALTYSHITIIFTTKADGLYTQQQIDRLFFAPMRFVKKERVDVKKFIDDMKANRTNKSYTSLQNRRPVNEEAHQNQQITSKCSFNSTDKYPPPHNMPSQKIKYGFEHQNPSYQPPYIPYIINDFGMTQHSQLYASPPFHQGLINYSQTFNSPQPFINYQDPTLIQHPFGEANNYSQIKGPGSKIHPINNDNSERLNPQNNHHLATLKKPNIQSNSLNLINITQKCQEPKDKKQQPPQQKPADQPMKKEGKKRQKRKNLVTQESKIIKRKETSENLCEKQIVEGKFKQIMSSFNIEIDGLAGKYLSPDVLQRLSSFQQRVSKMNSRKLMNNKPDFNTRLQQFQTSIIKFLKK